MFILCISLDIVLCMAYTFHSSGPWAMDNTKKIDASKCARTDLGRGESPAKVTMPMDHPKQLSPRLTISGRARRTSRADSRLTMPGRILASSGSQGFHNSFTPKNAPAPAAVQGHAEEEAGISTLAGLIQVLARIDARVNAKEPARA